VMIALFGALSFAMTRSMRTGASTATSEKSQLLAQEIIQMGTQIHNAVKAMQIDGCKDTEISFDGGSTNGDYSNPLSPTDEHCNVFSTRGGNLRVEKMGDGWGGERLFFGANVVESHDSSRDYGSSAPDLTLVRQVNLDTCVAINKLLIGPSYFWKSPTGQVHGMWESEGDNNGSRDGSNDTLNHWDTFQGDYSNSPGQRITINDNSYPNGGSADNTKLPPPAGCFCESDDECDIDTYPATTYYYYNVLIAR